MLSRGSAGRATFVSAAAVLLGLATIRVSALSYLRHRDPDAALVLAPTDSRALDDKAELMQQPDASPATFAQARRLAVRALLRDATEARAARVIALSDEAVGQHDRAMRLMAYSSALSSRDLPTHLWWIETAVRANDISRALRHYDAALRTDINAPQILFPILQSAIEDPALIDHIADMLAAHPAWGPAFQQALIRSPASMPAITALMRATGRRGAADPVAVSELFAVLSSRRETALAEQIRPLLQKPIIYVGD